MKGKKMSEEMKSAPTQEAQDTVAKNDQQTSSDAGLMPELMKYKSQRNELRDELASYKAKEEERRTKKLEEEGRHQEIIKEQQSTIEELKSTVDSQFKIVDSYKQNLVNGLASDEERKAYLATKSVDFLEELTKEKLAMRQDSTVNPLLNKNYADMTTNERKAWHEQVFNRKK